MLDLEKAVDAYVTKRLRETDYNYALVLGNTQALLYRALEGDTKKVIKILTDEVRS